MERWIVVFIGVTAAAVVVQAVAMVGAFLRLRRMEREVDSLQRRFEDRVEPLLDRLDYILRAVQSNAHQVLGDLAAITELGRRQAEKFDRLSDELTDRLRLQIVRADELVSRAFASLESAGEQIRTSVAGPLREAVAVAKGIRAALDVLTRERGSRRPDAAARVTSEEQLFI